MFNFPRYKKKGICRDCGNVFEKKAQNQEYCPECSAWKKYGGRSLTAKIRAAEPGLKKAADESGNPKIWTADRYSQEFLKSLIPSRQ